MELRAKKREEWRVAEARDRAQEKADEHKRWWNHARMVVEGELSGGVRAGEECVIRDDDGNILFPRPKVKQTNGEKGLVAATGENTSAPPPASTAQLWFCGLAPAC